MKNKTALAIYTFLFVCLLSTGKAVAQEHGIFELNTNETLSKTKAKNTKKNNRDKFYNLAQKLHTTAYASNNILNNVYGKGAIKKINFNDTKSFSLLKNEKFANTEIIVIKVNKLSDLSNVINLSTNINLGSLKYVFIKCKFKCTKEQIEKFVKVKPNSGIRIFYKTETPS